MKVSTKQILSNALLFCVFVLCTTSFTYVIEQFCTGRISQVTPNVIQFSIVDGDIPAVGISGKIAVEIEVELNGIKSKTWLDVAKVTVSQSSGSVVSCTIIELVKNNYGVSPEQYMQQPNNNARIQWRLAQ